MSKGEAKTGRKLAALLVEYPLMLLMGMSMVFPFTAALQFGLPFTTVFLTVTVLLALWTAVLFNRWTMLASFSLIAVVGVLLLLAFAAKQPSAGVVTFRAKFADFIYWAGMYLRGFRAENLQYASILVALFSAFVCLTVCVFTFKQFDMITVLLAGAACYVALIVIGHDINLPSLFCYILAATLYMLLNSYKKNARVMSAGHALPLPLHMASALPLAAIVLAITILLSGAVKIDAVWMKSVRDRLLQKTDTVASQVVKAASKTAITADELGGNMYLTDDPVMDVTSPVPNVHLRAQSRSYYTGHSWFRTNTDQEDFDPTDLDDTVLTKGIIASDPDSLEKLFPSVKLSIRYDDFNTGIVYAPLKLESIKIGEPMRLVGGDMLMLAQGDGGNLSYSLQYFQPAYKSAQLEDLLRNVGGDSYAGANDNDAFTFRNQYTQLPDELPYRVRALADQITQGLSNDYDKAVAVETYLRENFTYTLTPGSSDLSRDFVDQFLFENKRGYCTYFATAMAVLLRCEHIPARYVEGYVLPATAREGNVYRVTKKQGHAWTEVYFKDVGWMTFEPTASFSSDNAVDQLVSPTPSPAVKPSANPLPTSTTSITPAIKPVITPGKPDNSFILWIILLAFILFAGIISAVLIPLHAKNAMLKQSPRDAVIALFGQSIRLVEELGQAPRPEDGMEPFVRCVDRQFKLPDAGFSTALDIFRQARFSQHEITPEQKKTMLTFRSQLLEGCKKQLGIFKYLFFKFIWGI